MSPADGSHKSGLTSVYSHLLSLAGVTGIRNQSEAKCMAISLALVLHEFGMSLRVQTNLARVLHEFGMSFARVLHAFCMSLARVLHADMHML